MVPEVLFELVDADFHDVVEVVAELDARFDDVHVEFARLDVDDRLLLLVDDHEVELGIVLDQIEEDDDT